MNVKDIFKPTVNCWKTAEARRAAVIIDGGAYFRAVHEAMRQARRCIMIVGWDLHSELRMIRDGSAGKYPVRLGRFLNYLTRKRKGLDVYLLSWDFSMIYAMEREFFPRYNLKWRSHERIHFCLDGEHPVGGSQHQKVVVVDDAVAFAGGLDLTQQRWDTSEHLPRSSLRVNPEGKAYGPFHDVQMVVDGQAAAALGSLARQRWKQACGAEPAAAARDAAADPWPPGVEPDFTGIRVAVARTLPAYNGSPEVREAERLYLESIAAARRFIYAENQYLSSFRIGEALAARLEKSDGPEVVMVLPRKTGGWLEQHTMDVLRWRLVAKLLSADRHGRLRLYYPRRSVAPETDVMVHAKLMVIDDCFLRVGSSNLSNRSLGLDSECDLAVAAADGSPESLAIGAVRNRLLAEHLGAPADAVAQALGRRGSLIGAIESLRGGARTLEPLDCRVPDDIDGMVPETGLLDPEKPIEPQELLDYCIGPQRQRLALRNLVKIAALVGGALGCAALWRWTSLARWLNIDTAIAAAAWVESRPLSPLLVMAAYVLGGIVSFPVTVMIVATVAIFGPWRGFAYAMAGAELSAVVLFFVGRWLGRDVVTRYGGGLLNRVSRRLSDAGLVAVVTLRIIPVAPFSVINIVAGVSRVRMRDFALGTVIGMAPGIAAIAVVADRVAESLRSPDAGHFAAVLAALAAAGACLLGLRAWLRRRKPSGKRLPGGGP